MIKQCVVLNGNLINIGPWDYQYVDMDGEQVALNPLPEGAVIEDKEVFQSEDGGWYAVGLVPAKTPEQIQIEQLKAQIAQQNSDMTAFMDFYFESIGE